MLNDATVKALQQKLFASSDSGDGSTKRTTKKKKTKGRRKKKQPAPRRLSAPLNEEAVMTLVATSHKSDANDYAVSTMLDQRKRDYLSAEMMRMMSTKPGWVGSPSSQVKLTFSRTANYHIVNKQDMLNYDRYVPSKSV